MPPDIVMAEFIVEDDNENGDGITVVPDKLAGSLVLPAIVGLRLPQVVEVKLMHFGFGHVASVFLVDLVLFSGYCSICWVVRALCPRAAICSLPEMCPIGHKFTAPLYLDERHNL